MVLSGCYTYITQGYGALNYYCIIGCYIKYCIYTYVIQLSKTIRYVLRFVNIA